MLLHKVGFVQSVKQSTDPETGFCNAIPEGSSRLIVETLGIEPDFIGLVDHESVGNDFERNAGKVSIINLLIEQIQAIELDS